jgi:hypothetical protein
MTHSIPYCLQLPYLGSLVMEQSSARILSMIQPLLYDLLCRWLDEQQNERRIIVSECDLLIVTDHCRTNEPETMIQCKFESIVDVQTLKLTMNTDKNRHDEMAFLPIGTIFLFCRC